MQDRSWISFDGNTYPVPPGRSALEAMRAGGAEVTFSCQTGVCSSCMLRALSGDPGEAAVANLPRHMQEQGLFLPCCATEVRAVEAVRPDPTQIVHEAVVAGKTPLSPRIIELQLELVSDVDWHPGEVIALIGPDGTARSYSIVSLKREDYFLEVHVGLHRGGCLSGWVSDGLEVGDLVHFRGPTGAFVYDDSFRGRPLVMIGTGAGGGALLGILRDALARGHDAPISVYHGARDRAGLHLRDRFAALSATIPGLSVTCAASREAIAGLERRRVTEIAFETHTDLSESVVFLCGSGAMVEAARTGALRQGAAPARILSDAFLPHFATNTTCGSEAVTDGRRSPAREHA